MEKIETFENACAAIGVDAATVLPDLSVYPASLRKSLTSVAKLLIINAALNEDWMPVYTSEKEPRYLLTWDMEKYEGNPKGFKLSSIKNEYTVLSVPVRFTYSSERLAEYAAGQFEDVFLDIMKDEATQQVDAARKLMITETIEALQAIHEELAPGQVKNGKIKPATDQDIATLEEMVGDKLPVDFVEYLKTQSYRLHLNRGYSSYSVEEVISELAMMNKHLQKGTFDDGRVEDHVERNFGNWDGDYLKKVWWSSKWIPFAQDGCGNMKCIDLDPGKKGRKEQILSMEIQEGQGPYIDHRFGSFTPYMNNELCLVRDKHYRLEDVGKNNILLFIDEDETAE